MRELVKRPVRYGDSVQKPPCTVTGIIERNSSCHKGGGQYFNHSLSRVQAAERVLEHHLDQITNPFSSRNFSINNWSPEQFIVKRLRRNQPDKRLYKRRFPTARFTHNAQYFPLRKGERHMVHRSKVVPDLAQHSTTDWEADRKSVHLNSRNILPLRHRVDFTHPFHHPGSPGPLAHSSRSQAESGGTCAAVP